MRRFLGVILCAHNMIYALPQGGVVTGGEATIQQVLQEMQITSSDRAVIQWDSFSIGLKEAVKILQPSSTSALLNCVKGSEMSSLMGLLQSNGLVYLINPQGCIVGKDAFIDTAGFIASTFPIEEGDFLQGGDFLFKGDSEASFIQLGTIHCSQGPVVVLAHRIEQEGTIETEGTLSLLSAHEILLKPSGEGLISIRPDLSSAGIDQKGSLEALRTYLEAVGPYGCGIRNDQKGYVLAKEGGSIWLRGHQCNVSQEGTLKAPGGTIEVEADRLFQHGDLEARGGKISLSSFKCQQSGTLRADEGGSIDVKTDAYVESSGARISATEGSVHIDAKSGRLFSSGKYTAPKGMIHLTGTDVVLSGAKLDAEEGEICVGGGFQGQDPNLHNSRWTYLNGSTVISAKEGRVVIWSDGKTEHYGAISSKFIEVSGKEDLALGGTTDAPQVLFDPHSIVIDDAAGVYPQYQLIDPHGGNGSSFGQHVVSLLDTATPSNPTGNIVVTKPDDTFGGMSSAGAVYLYQGLTGKLISILTGSATNDQVGSGGVVALKENGNFVILSPEWNGLRGAATWGSGTAGIAGVVSSSNSLVGTQPVDRVGSDDVTALTNGNYVVVSSEWRNGTAITAGAATWGNGTTGITGAVSSNNSLVGTTADDQVGKDGVTTLTNGNYVVASPYWKNGTNTYAGAVTWGSGTTGITGVVSASNSLVGTQPNDRVGSDSFTALITPLTNGNYVVQSPIWNNGTASRAGAATWGSGTTGITGEVSSANSLVGTQIDDYVGKNGVTALLTNGNYVVASSQWRNGTAAAAGAATWGNGTTGITGVVSASNSLVGTQTNDQVGIQGVTALTNGNYVVSSPEWNNGAFNQAGAATWGSGATGITGAVSASNSLVGTTADDRVGSSGVTALLINGNYVVASAYWKNGTLSLAGAVTWGSGTTGITGAVSSTNSLVGTQKNDQVGIQGVTALTNGNYVVSSPNWSNGAAMKAGASTWGSGTTGITGAVSSTNSLFGTQKDDLVGSSGVTTLTNGNYVVISSSWWNGTATQAGAATWGNGTTGITGAVSSTNSLVGTQTNDQVGINGVTTLTNGNYVVASSFWKNGTLTNAGAATWGSGTTGHLLTGEGPGATITPQNSIIGGTASAGLTFKSFNKDSTFNTQATEDGKGVVRIGLDNINQITCQRASPTTGNRQTFTIPSSVITAVLNTGAEVTLQANTDITVNSPIVVMAGGSGGALTLQAGRSVIVNQAINTDNGDLILYGDAAPIDCVVVADRAAGPGVITTTGIITTGTGAYIRCIGGPLSVCLSPLPPSGFRIPSFLKWKFVKALSELFGDLSWEMVNYWDAPYILYNQFDETFYIDLSDSEKRAQEMMRKGKRRLFFR